MGSLGPYINSCVPPGRSSDVDAIAAIGEHALPAIEFFLRRHNFTVTADIDDCRRSGNAPISIWARPEDMYQLEWCIQALGRIGSRRALDVLSRLRPELKEQMVQALVNVWLYFPPADFVQNVLTELQNATVVVVRDALLLPFTGLLPQQYKVYFDAVVSVHDLDMLRGSRISSIEVDAQGIQSWDWLLDVDGLHEITLLNVIGFTLPVDATFPTVNFLSINYERSSDFLYLLDCQTLKSFPSLEDLAISGTVELTNLEALQVLSGLRTLEIEDGYFTQSWDDAGLSLPRLMTLAVGYWPMPDYFALVACSALEELVSRASEAVDLIGLERLPRLRTVDVSLSDSLRQIDAASGIERLEVLDLSHCSSLNAEALDIIDRLADSVDITITGSNLEQGETAYFSERRAADLVDIGSAVEPAGSIDWATYMVESVVGISDDDGPDGQIDAEFGWLIGTLEDIESPSRASPSPDTAAASSDTSTDGSVEDNEDDTL